VRTLHEAGAAELPGHCEALSFAVLPLFASYRPWLDAWHLAEHFVGRVPFSFSFSCATRLVTPTEGTEPSCEG